MIYSLLVVVGVAGGLFWASRWRQLPAKQRKQFGQKSLLWAAAIVLLALVFTGRAHWLMGVLAALLALATRLAALAQFIPFFKKIFGDVQQSARPSSPSGKAMTRQEAADILGVKNNASAEEVRQAHKKLMQKLHPDRGGSDALAKQINNAKDVMLK